jgi:aerobic-type carbon monoxide dehydrogenase small subunit (CoxS/CutS family)
VTFDLQVNGRPYSLTVDPRTTLLDTLREHLALRGSPPKRPTRCAMSLSSGYCDAASGGVFTAA